MYVNITNDTISTKSNNADVNLNYNPNDKVCDKITNNSNGFFEAKVDNNYLENSGDVDKLIINKTTKDHQNELIRKTSYFKNKNWDAINQIKRRTQKSKAEIINIIIEYGLENLVIK